MVTGSASPSAPACHQRQLPVRLLLWTHPQPIQALILDIIVKQPPTSCELLTDTPSQDRVLLPYHNNNCCTAAIHGYGGGWVVVSYPVSNVFNFLGHSPHNEWWQIVSEVPAYVFQTWTMNGRQRGAHSTDGNDNPHRHNCPSRIGPQSIGFPIRPRQGASLGQGIAGVGIAP